MLMMINNFYSIKLITIKIMIAFINNNHIMIIKENYYKNKIK